MKIPIALCLTASLILSACGQPMSDAEVMEAATRGLGERCHASRAGLASMPQAQFDRFCECSVQKSLEVLGPEGRRKFANARPWSEAETRNVKQASVDCMKMFMKP